MRKLEKATRAPTLWRWVHFATAGGDFFLHNVSPKFLLTLFRLIAKMLLARFLGDVAQLGERCLRKAEAEGSNPFISTI